MQFIIVPVNMRDYCCCGDMAPGNIDDVVVGMESDAANYFLNSEWEYLDGCHVFTQVCYS